MPRSNRRLQSGEDSLITSFARVPNGGITAWFHPHMMLRRSLCFCLCDINLIRIPPSYDHLAQAGPGMPPDHKVIWPYVTIIRMA